MVFFLLRVGGSSQHCRDTPANIHCFNDEVSPGEQSQQMSGNVLELDAMRQLLFNVRFHLANNVVSIRRSGGIAEGLLQFRQESGHLVSLPSDHYSIDLLKMPTTVVDRRDAAIQYDGQV